MKPGWMLLLPVLLATMPAGSSSSRSLRVNVEPCVVAPRWAELALSIAPYTQFNNWGHLGGLLQHSVWAAHSAGNYFFAEPGRGCLPDFGAFSARDVDVLQVCALLHDLGKVNPALPVPEPQWPLQRRPQDVADGEWEAQERAFLAKDVAKRRLFVYGRLAARDLRKKREVLPDCSEKQAPPACEPRGADNKYRHDFRGWQILSGESKLRLTAEQNASSLRPATSVHELVKSAVGSSIVGGWTLADTAKCALLARFHYQLGDFAGSCGNVTCADDPSALARRYAAASFPGEARVRSWPELVERVKTATSAALSRHFSASPSECAIDWSTATCIRASFLIAGADVSSNVMVEPAQASQYSARISPAGKCRDLQAACGDARAKEKYGLQCELAASRKSTWASVSKASWREKICGKLSRYFEREIGLSLNCEV